MRAQEVPDERQQVTSPGTANRILRGYEPLEWDVVSPVFEVPDDALRNQSLLSSPRITLEPRFV